MNLTSTRVLTLLGLAIVVVPACGGRRGISPDVAGGAAGTGAAGTGAAGTGSAGSGAAGTGAAGRAGNEGATGGTGASGTTGSAGMGASGPAATRADGTCIMNAYKYGGSVCRCQDGAPDVCGDFCTDLSVDDDNCGTCGHKCAATSTCNAGQCGPEVVNVVPAAPGCGSLQLALADGTLYWTDHDHGTVNSLALGANAKPVTLTSGEVGPGLVEVRGSDLFWVDTLSIATPGASISPAADTAVIRHLALPGVAPVDVVTESNGSGGILGLAISEDGSAVYYSAATKVRSVSAAGGSPIDVGREERGGLPTALGLEGNSIGYITDLNGNVDAMSVRSGAIASCGADDANGNGLYVDCQRFGECTPDALLERFIIRGGKAYWADSSEVRTGTLGADGMHPWTVVASSYGGNGIGGLAAAPDALYFAEHGDDYTMREATIDKTPYAENSTPVVIARAQFQPHALVTDAKYVYWATGDCAINAVAR